ncbi:MAG: DUF1932 domain-containing protein [Burkholderiaceae bacterium]
MTSPDPQAPLSDDAAATRCAITLVGFGEVGQVLADDLLAGGQSDITVYDIAFADPQSAPSRAAAQRAVRRADNAAQAGARADLVICAVTAAADLEAARAVAAGIAGGAFYVDLNSASPGSKQQAAALVDAAGGRYVEAAVMAPIDPRRIASVMLLGGPHAQALQPLLHRLGFVGSQVFADTVGPASATKMCRSVIIKGVEALLTESMLAARHYGVEQVVLDSLSDLLPIGDWPRLARYMISRSVEHGVRRAEEMREVSHTLSEAGVSAWMTDACVTRQSWAPRHKAALEHPALGEMLDAMRATPTKSLEEKPR